MAWVVRTNGAAGISDRLRQAAAEALPGLRAERWKSMDEIVASTTADSRFDAWLCGIFAGVALLLTATGIYGLLSFSVARRTGEIGTRLALGATRGDVLKLVLRQGIGLIAIGLVAGLAGAIVLTRSLRGLLFGVRPTDPISFLLVAMLLVTVGLLASYLPARRATRIDPLSALRSE
jgi:putative ABC transport system permease protein